MLNANFFCANGLMPPSDCSCDINDGERCQLNVTGEVTCILPENVVEMSYDFPSWGIVRACVYNYVWCSIRGGYFYRVLIFAIFVGLR